MNLALAIPAQRLKREEGSALVEYAIVFILFMTMILGIMDFARALYIYHFLSHEAREATRFAAMHGSTCENDADGGSCTPTGGPASPGNTDPITTFVKDFTPPGIDSSKVVTTPTWPVNADSPAICAGSAGPPAVTAVPNAPGCTVQVQLSYTFNFMFSWIRQASMTLSSTSQMIISH